MNYCKKNITADGFAVSFSLNGIEGYFDCAEDVCERLLKDVDGEIMLFAHDRGYYALGKRVKDRLTAIGKQVSCFCFDDGFDCELSVKKIISDENRFSCAIVIGDGFAATTIDKLIGEKPLLFLPLDFEFDAFLIGLKNKNRALVFDRAVYTAIKKNKLLNGIKSVLSKRIAYVESYVYQLIGEVIENLDATSTLNYGQELLKEYLKTLKIQTLVLSQFLCSVAILNLPIAFAPCDCSAVALKMQSSADGCDLEFVFYKALLKIYYLYFNNDINFISQLPDVIFEREQLNEFALSPVQNLPKFLFDNERISQIKEKTLNNEQISSIVLQQLNQVSELEKTFKKIYAGRKYTVEHYGEKERAKAVSLSPLLSEKFSALQIVWADGVLQYFN